MSKLVYEIDDRDRFVALGSDWKAFAEANGGEGLDLARLIGRSLFEFISGPTVREIYAAVIAKARSGRSVRFQYRCDAPAWRREFEMVVAATAPTRVTFVSTLLRETLRPDIPLFAAPRPGKRVVRMCSWCHAVASRAGGWLPLESAIGTLGLMEEDKEQPAVTHGICAACADRMFSTLNSNS